MSDTEEEQPSRPRSGRPTAEERGLQRTNTSPVRISHQGITPEGEGLVAEMTVPGINLIPVRIDLPRWRGRASRRKLVINITINGTIEVVGLQAGRSNRTPEQELGIVGVPDLRRELQPSVSGSLAGVVSPYIVLNEVEREEIRNKLQFEVERYYLTSTRDIDTVIRDFLFATVTGSDNETSIENLRASATVWHSAGVNYGPVEFRLGFEPHVNYFPPALIVNFLEVDTEILEYGFTHQIAGQNYQLKFVGHVIFGVSLKKDYIVDLITAIAARFGFGVIWSDLMAISSSWRIALLRLIDSQLETVLSARAANAIRATGRFALGVGILAATAAATIALVAAFGWMINHAHQQAVKQVIALFWAKGFINRLFFPEARSAQERERRWLEGIHNTRRFPRRTAAIDGVERAIEILREMNQTEEDLIESVAQLLEAYDDQFPINRSDRNQMISRLSILIYREGQVLESNN